MALGVDETANDAYGGGIYSYSCSPMLTNCSLSGNSVIVSGSSGGSTAAFGGAIYSVRATLILTNCSLTGNFANVSGGDGNYASGGAIYDIQSSTAVLTNCSLQGNQATSSGEGSRNEVYGGAIYNDNSSLVLTNCSLQSNQVTLLDENGNNNYVYGGAIYNTTYRSSVLTNCISWSNGGDNTFHNSSSSSPVMATFSLFDNTNGIDISGPGNLTTAASPFASPASVALAACSPAIDAADLNSYLAVNGPSTDLVGQPRIFPAGGKLDMGAVEYQGLPPVAQILSLRADESGCPVKLVGQGVGTAFIFTGPQGYVFSNVFRTGGTHDLTGLEVKQPGIYTLTATYVYEYCISAPVSQTVNVSRICP